jgi:SpoVK/Ycf46/Vps4 family AAA+-type ATPase
VISPVPDPAPDVFELELTLPHPRLTRAALGLVGFRGRYLRLRSQLRLRLEAPRLDAWSLHFYGRRLPLLDAVVDALPLALFHGDVGCGKTATAKCAANQVANDLGEPAVLRALSTRVRGTGAVGQMSELLNDAFDDVVDDGARMLSFLLIDEADSLGEARSEEQAHHEDRVAVNTLIQRLDALGSETRVFVFLCTNRLDHLDPALVRRSHVETFERPSFGQRLQLLSADLAGSGIAHATLRRVAELTGSHEGGVGFTYSDLRQRLLREAVARAYPRRAIEDADLVDLAQRLSPSPSLLTSEGS